MYCRETHHVARHSDSSGLFRRDNCAKFVFQNDIEGAYILHCASAEAENGTQTCCIHPCDCHRRVFSKPTAPFFGVHIRSQLARSSLAVRLYIKSNKSLFVIHFYVCSLALICFYATLAVNLVQVSVATLRKSASGRQWNPVWLKIGVLLRISITICALAVSLRGILDSRNSSSSAQQQTGSHRHHFSEGTSVNQPNQTGQCHCRLAQYAEVLSHGVLP